jgi:transcriptional regulator with XRE-family HTH domain
MEPYPPPGAAARIRAARTRAGLDPQTVSEVLGISLPAYFDLEAFDDELFTCLSLEELIKLAQVLGATPLSLVAGDNRAHEVTAEMSLTEVISRIPEYIRLHGLTAAAFSERVGWDISEALLDPESAWHSWNLDWLYDVCAELQIEWMAVLRARPPQGG